MKLDLPTGHQRRHSGYPAPLGAKTPLWYRDALIYQVHIRSFRDSDGDGIGDFRGLAEKLDYIHDLGITALWLLPFYPSPLRDDGYDIADYTNVNPIYGTLDDFKLFLEEAHRRELRVITELVMNHTSDQHPWFQRARRSPRGSEHRDFYVWSDDPHKYREARIIFQDFESSNWTWDPLAEAYYWHRFYHHQPDLNFESPAVRQAMFDVLDFWFEMGVDGLRLDAVPYLYEREGTNCENLPETHAFLKEVRSYIDSKYEDRMLLAEANQWPEDAAAYFGDGDECHMNFHFPLMPRLYMAIQREDRLPIIDILDQTPAIPDNCQWAIFLRNHDELTLEMVTDEERDYMYRAYAEDPQARLNLGIRRRLSPLMKNNRRKIELMNGLLLSLPGTPIIYYGDEIGMGDNIYLGDRNGVRTPMQWTADRNAGFSSANPQKLFLPPVIDPEYHYTARNVEIAQNSPNSLLWWMRHIIRLRKEYTVFGRGSIEFLTPDNPKVLAFVREQDEQAMLVVANTSRYIQYAELDLSRFRGRIPREVFGQSAFPRVGELPYLLTLGPHSFYWLNLELSDAQEASRNGALPTLRSDGAWHELFTGKRQRQFVAALPAYLQKQRWYAGKARTIQSSAVEEVLELPGSADDLPIRLLLIRIDYTEGEPERYQLPLAFVTGARAENIIGDRPNAGVAAVTAADGTEGILCDATEEAELWHRLLRLISENRRIAGVRGTAAGTRSAASEAALAGDEELEEPTVHGGQQSNTLAVFDETMVLKIFRRVDQGENPDLEIGRFLTEVAPYPHVPSVFGSLNYRQGRGELSTLAILQEFKANQGDAWTYTLEELDRFVTHISSELSDQPPAPTGIGVEDLLRAARSEPSDLSRAAIGHYLYEIELLGQRTAEMHLALASSYDDRRFAPEEFTSLYQRALYQSFRTQAIQTFDFLGRRVAKLPEDVKVEAEEALTRKSYVLERIKSLIAQKITAIRIRTHGDYHLGQVLYNGKDFFIIDFEGEPDRAISERRIKRSPLRDVAGMLRSFHYASYSASIGALPVPITEGNMVQSIDAWMRFWYASVAAAFLRAYLNRAEGSAVIPEDEGQLGVLLHAYTLEKVMYEIRYELNNRPDWLPVPLAGIRQLTDGAG